MHIRKQKSRVWVFSSASLPASQLLRKTPAAGTSTVIAIIMKLDKDPSARGNLGLFEKLHSTNILEPLNSC